MTQTSFDPIPQIALELNISNSQVAKVITLLDDSSTVPFIARYRKEVTGNLDEVQIREIQERRDYLTALEKRRSAILESIELQGKLTDDLRSKILACTTKTGLEDLYLPYKPKRQTKAMIAREKGLEPLAERILEQPAEGDPQTEAQTFVNEEKGIADAAAALEGARHIVAEIVAENADVRAFVRDTFSSSGVLTSKVLTSYEDKATKWNQYYDFQEPIGKIPSHRFLAIRRGEKEGVLTAHIDVDTDTIQQQICQMMSLNLQSPFGVELLKAIEDSYKRLIHHNIEVDLFVEVKMRSDNDAIEIFAQNLETLLLSAPLGERSVIGVDPGLRTGCKCAVTSSTGKFIETVTFYLSTGADKQVQAEKILEALVTKHKPYAIAVGNGTGGRETEAFVRQVLKKIGASEVIVVQVSESGASVYSASDVAREEFPDLDLTIRGAISIARRLQDPLAELVKVDPKSIGVGQYQHDVYQPSLERKLGEVVESCVNKVGVELNTASASILSYVAGIGPSLAKNIVSYRDSHGAFKSRKDLLGVSGLGPRAFEQAAGFLRVRGGSHPLDASAVHPERYTIVEKMVSDLGVDLNESIGNAALISKIDKKKYLSDDLGELTLTDIIDELKKPGRDPRQEFEPPAFREDVSEISDLVEGMILEGVVTNVTAFGAFVDIGVHQDGLVHISELSDRFIKSPSEVVSTGDKIKVQVLEVDRDLKRISLSARVGQPPKEKRELPKRNENEKAPQKRYSKSKGQKAQFRTSPFSSL